jgi:phage major head subunit gpT-like protein
MDALRSKIDELFQMVDMRFSQAQLQTPTHWDYVASQVPSTTAKNVYPWMSKLPAFQLWTGDNKVSNVKSRDYTLINKTYRMGFDISKDDLVDDTIGLFGDVVADAGRSRAEFPDQNVFATLEAGTANVCWDGQFFYDTDHPVDIDNASKGQYANLLIGAGYDWSIDPVGAFRQVRTAMMKFQRDDGTRVGLVPNILIGGPDMEGPILKAIEANFVTDIVKNAGTPVAAAGVTNVFVGKAIGIITPWIQSSTRVHALCTTRGMKPLLYQLREDEGLIASVDPTSLNVFKQRKFEWGHFVRAAFGYGLPQFAICSGAS